MNIVFDLGGVVFNWQPDILVAKAFSDPKTQLTARKQIIGHQDWLDLDRGTLTLNQAITRASERTKISNEDIERFFDQVAPSLTPIEDTIQLIRCLAMEGRHDLFVLSNMHYNSIEYLEQNYDFWSLFKARVISCRIQMIKPEPQIYAYLLKSNSLVAQETVFIDDVRENTEAAKEAGISTIEFVDTASCRTELERLGCLKAQT